MAISSDPPERLTAWQASLQPEVLLLADRDLVAIDRFSLRHRGGGPDKSDISRPATFVVGADGTIRSVHAAIDIFDRPPASAVIDLLQK